jgi:hypothetical protein
MLVGSGTWPERDANIARMGPGVTSFVREVEKNSWSAAIPAARWALEKHANEANYAN